MNDRRLSCLAAVLDASGLSVGEVAEAAAIPENQTSVNLRALQSRGLLTARRDGRFIRYFSEADPLVEHAAIVLVAVRRELVGRGRLRLERLTRTLRAFSHSRRLTILRCLLLEREATCEEIVAATRISQPAVSRHLVTLRLSGLIMALDNGAWRLVEGKKLPAIARALLNEVLR